MFNCCNSYNCWNSHSNCFACALDPETCSLICVHIWFFVYKCNAIIEFWHESTRNHHDSMTATTSGRLCNTPRSHWFGSLPAVACNTGYESFILERMWFWIGYSLELRRQWDAGARSEMQKLLYKYDTRAGNGSKSVKKDWHLTAIARIWLVACC